MARNKWFNNLFDGIFRFSKKDAEETNYKYEIFDKLITDVNIEDWSAVNKYFRELEREEVSLIGDNMDMMNDLYGSISTNKPVRLASYRRMGAFPEVGDAIDEICDASITADENGKCVTLTLPTSKYSQMEAKEIETAWEEYINLFDFKNRMFDYMRTFIIEGELGWENVISKNKPEAGILDIKYLPADTYEFTYNMKTNERVGLTVYINDDDIDLDGHRSNQKQTRGNYTVGGINISTLNTHQALADERAVFLPFEQCTYINTGIFNTMGTFVLPVLERSRRAYNQLAMIEDAIIIYRLVRAPERLVFNVDVGSATRSKAEQEVLKMMKKYNTKKVYNPSTGTVANDYDVHSMIESFWFVKSAGGDGTSVESIGGGQNLGELEDLQYFLRKLYLTLKIPYNRFEEPTVNIDKSTSINYEEYRFARFVKRLQNRFALGIKEGFKTHLKLKGIWKANKMKDLDLDIEFTAPAAFDNYEEQQRMAIKMDHYTSLADREEFSKTLCMKKFLGWTDEEIDENWKALERDAIKQAIINYKVRNAEETGKPEGLNDEPEDKGW